MERGPRRRFTPKKETPWLIKEIDMLSKSQAKLFFLGGTAVFGSIFIALTVDSMKQVPERTHEDRMTEQVVAGKKIWEKNNCMGCHTLFGEGAYYAPELTKVYDRRGPEWIKIFLKDPEAMFPGQRKMVNYHFSDSEIDNVVAFLKWCGEVDLNGFPAKPPLRDWVSAPVTATTPLSTPTHPQPGVFQTLCIACHALGGQGGKVGPALDSVFARKSRAEIAEWIADPPKVKPGTLMPKLPLTQAQVDSLSDYLAGLGGAQ
jgi:nitric oxide reductase subunit C